MIEETFLTVTSAWLGTVGLQPVPRSIDMVEPAQSGDLPVLVLSLQGAEHAGMGLGNRTSVRTGALRWAVAISLAQPFLPGEPGFSLVNANRRELILPHGGLVRADGSEGALAATDLQVTVAGGGQTLVNGVPAAGQFSVEPQTGRLTFGTPLPATGTVQATYRLGQWEQKVERVSGTLRLDAYASTPAQVRTLGLGAGAALTGASARVGIPRLLSMEIKEVSSISAPIPGLGTGRRMSLRFQFEFESEINEPESSGGIILRIPADATIST